MKSKFKFNITVNQVINKKKDKILNKFKLKNLGDRKKENEVLNLQDKKLKD